MCVCVSVSLSHTHTHTHTDTAFSDRQADGNFLSRLFTYVLQREREIDGLIWLQAQWVTFTLRSLYPYTSAYLSCVSGQEKEPRGHKVAGSTLWAQHALYPFQFRQDGPCGSERAWGREKGDQQLKARGPAWSSCVFTLTQVSGGLLLCWVYIVPPDSEF